MTKMEHFCILSKYKILHKLHGQHMRIINVLYYNGSVEKS